MEEIENIVWDVIDCYFRDNPQSLVRHHLDSYNNFYKEDIFKIFNEMNPIKIVSKFDETTKEHKSECNLYLGGKDGKRIYFAKPTIYDGEEPRYMFPNEARLRNMTYAMTIHYDVEVEILNKLGEYDVPINYGEEVELEEEEKRVYKDPKTDKEFLATMEDKEGKEHVGNADRPAKNKYELQMTANQRAEMVERLRKSVDVRNIQRHTFILEKIYLGKFPIMVQSDLCILSGLPKEIRFNMGECRNDVGGYFIIDGKEKTIIPQEKFGDNMLRVSKSSNDEFLYSAEIKSVSENSSKPIRSLRVDIVAPSKKYSNRNIVVNIPNVRAPVPLFIVFRALGVISDKEIIKMCLLVDDKDVEKNEDLADLFISSVHDAGPIMTQINALQFIAQLAKNKTIPNALLILSDYFLPHIGETNFIEKAYFLGYMVKRLVSTYNGLDMEINRDSYRYKRIELTGTMIYQLFREYLKIQSKAIYVRFETILYNDQTNYESRLDKLIKKNYQEVFKKNCIVEDGFKKAYKGNWGSTEHTKRIGAVQDLNRLSFNSALSHLRKTNLSVDSGSKLVGPRVLNGSQWGLLDPIDTPDGGNIGLHKHLSLLTYVTRHVSREPMIKWLIQNVALKPISICSHESVVLLTKVFINGYWAGNVEEAIPTVNKITFFRRNGLIPLYISVSFDVKENMISIFTDGGRLCRPIFYFDSATETMSYMNLMDELKRNKYSWNDLVSGFNKKRDEALNTPNYDKFYNVSDLYEISATGDKEIDPIDIKRFREKKALLDYLDPNEEEMALIAFKPTKDLGNKYTHCEIHESLIFGMMCNMIIYPHHNPATRNSFSCGQSKQAVSLYHTNYNMRMDKTAVILNQGQKPLVKSRYLQYITNEENSYGENAIVAISCYTGYNVEDAVLINEGALKRGLFRTTYFSVYEAHEEKIKTNESYVEKKFTNIEKSSKQVLGLKMGFDYSKIDKYGLVKEGTEITDSTIIIGMASGNPAEDKLYDCSETTKKGQLGIVHKTFITEGEEGTRIAKIKIREERIPAIGDKMASRSGQKGTIGMIIPEADMPFTKDGIRPDIIINPHAIPTRMTIGQLVECIVGKACLHHGFHGDCTAFNSNGNQIAEFGNFLTKCGMHSSGSDILYNGMTGEQMESEIFMGPTYYMRLKHMVKDKVNFRNTGPRTQLTRQPVAGRANDGGLRIGEMERDSIISHGATEFLKESMLVRGDQYYMAICNKTGGIAIYNPEKNLFLSPQADGPLKFVDTLDGTNSNIEHITKYGRSFSIVRIPYVFKLFLQELQTINVKMSIITEDNINQFDSMNFSKNISLLTNGKSVNGVINDISEKVDLLENRKPRKLYDLDYDETPEEIIKSLEKDSLGDNEYVPNSPPYNPVEQDNGEYVPNSPPYFPIEQDDESYRQFETPEAMIREEGPDGKVRERPRFPGVLNWYFSDLSKKDKIQLLKMPEKDQIDFLKNVEIMNRYKYGRDSNEPKLSPMVYRVGEHVNLNGDGERLWIIDKIDRSNIIIRTNNMTGLDHDIKVIRAEDISPVPYSPTSFKTGDLVYFDGDYKKTRVWRIVKIEKSLAVLQTEDMEGLDNGTKVVHISDLRGIPRSPMMSPLSSPLSSLSQQQTPELKFSPTINIITGDGDNNIETLKADAAVAEESADKDIFSQPLIRTTTKTEDSPEKSDGVLSRDSKNIVVKKV
jgi:DNA-directed RNA polymerase II subunit RPB2